MEAVRDFIPRQDADPGIARDGFSGVDDALALLQEVGSTAVSDAAFWGFRTASHFAGCVEELSRTVEYLQLVAASAVDRTRAQSTARRCAGVADGSTTWAIGWAQPESGPSAPAGPAGPSGNLAENPADDGYRNTTEFLRARLRISASEARRRLCLAGALLPRQGLAGQQLPPERAELGAAVAAGEVPSRSAAIVTAALDRVRHSCAATASEKMEHALTLTAAEHDPDFLVRVAQRWTIALDQDGAEPSEEKLRQLQGAFIRRPRHGLQHMEIFATAEQFEHLLTVMNSVTNPRAGGSGLGEATTAGSPAATMPDPSNGVPTVWPAADESQTGISEPGPDRRSRPQMHLDGLVCACKTALATGTLPAAGGMRPQVMVTIDYRDLLGRLGSGDEETPGTASSSGTLMFTGPVTAATVRKIACDADVIPVLLGGNGRVLDIGRTSRIFPAHIRKALATRDRGCSFPGCTIPAPWCEAHHITYWSRGGSTGTDNGTLLCSHHHHLIHKEQWIIQVRTGIPWFIPPPHIDPQQRARRNHYFRPADLGTAS
jgi:hypothetical protein